MPTCWGESSGLLCLPSRSPSSLGIVGSREHGEAHGIGMTLVRCLVCALFLVLCFVSVVFYVKLQTAIQKQSKSKIS